MLAEKKRQQHKNSMNNILRNKLSKLESITNSLLNDLENHNPEILHLSPDDSQWSVVQVLNHLKMVELGSLGYVRKKILGIDNVSNIGFPSQLGMLLLKTSVSLKMKYKAPKSVSNPAGDTSLDLVIVEWKESRKQLTDFLEKYPDEWINRAIFKHPITGRISLPQMLRFFQIHLKHHINQIARILKTVEGSI
jgi:hypothetical protein